MRISSICAAAALLAAVAHADVGYFVGSGSDIVLASTADVQMVSEDVTIAVRPDSAEYHCLFELKNLSDQPVELQAGFPLSGDAFSDSGPEEDISEVKLVAETYRFLARDDDATYHVRYVRHDAQQKFKHLFLWTMRFAPSETRRLHVSYEIRSSQTLWSTSRKGWEILAGKAKWDPGDATEGLNREQYAEFQGLLVSELDWFSYVTETAGSWAGTVERADFHVGVGLADKALRTLVEDEMRKAATHPLPGVPPPPVSGPLLVWFGLAPAGWTVAVDSRGKPRLSDATDSQTGQPIPLAYDWHFAPFKPGVEFIIAWMTTFLPATADGVRAALQNPAAKTVGVQDLAALRAALAAWRGVAPTDDAIRPVIENRLWYAPVAGRKEADLSDDVKAQLALIDAAIAARKPK